MPRTCTLALTPRQRRTLARVRDQSPVAHLREKAAALLKVADGWRVRNVPQLGLLRPRSRNIVAAGVARFRARGLAGLRVRPGRGRKPAFSPLRPDPGPGRTR